jgi:hypothetical protein
VLIPFISCIGFRALQPVSQFTGPETEWRAKPSAQTLGEVQVTPL